MATAVLVALVVVAGMVLTGALLAGRFGPLAGDSNDVSGGDPAADGDRGVATASRTASLSASPSESPFGAGTSPSTLLTVDLHPVGQLDPDELPITRVNGAPEVVPFPTPFDRSIRLGGAATGFCLEAAAPAEGRAASAAFDLNFDKAGAAGWLTISLPATADGPPIGLRLDIAMLGELDRETWYRLTVTADGEATGGGRVVVYPAGGGGPVLERELSIDATVPSSAGDVCVQSSLQAPEAALFIDNLRVDG